MITADRLAELETLAIDPDVHDDARFSVPARDLRDLVKLVPIVRELFTWDDSREADAGRSAYPVMVELAKLRGRE